MESREIDEARRTTVARLCGYGSALAGAAVLPGCGAAGQEHLEASASDLGSSDADLSLADTKAAVLTRRFVATSADFPNPDRGLAGWGGDLMSGADYWTDNTVNPEAVARGYRLVRCQTVLMDYGYVSGAPISAAHLDNLRRGLQLLRRHGLKCIYRFMYACPTGGEDYRNPPHPPLSAILSHIRQLGAVFQENSDVLAATEAGFLGPWGEWHSSPLTDDSTTRLQVRDRLLASFPGIILFRYPSHIRQWYGESITRESGGPPEAWRIGMHNDSILSLGMNNGYTWRSDDFHAVGANADVDDDRLYIRRLVWNNAYGGEIAPEDIASTYLAQMADPLDHANKDFFFHHIQYLNAAGSALTQIRTLLDARDPSFYPAWVRRIGYRIVLKTASHDARVARNGRLRFSLTLRNEGVARMMLPRPFKLCLVPRSRGSAAREFTIEGIQPRDWVPTYDDRPDVATGTHYLSLAGLERGEYDLGIRMPDAHASLAADPRYCVRPANADVAATSWRDRFQGWDARSGTFMLGSSVQVG